ncbi:unnamed protein product [Chironomus riparius]|uniref:Lipoprotein n=1 Tax=Chironomus riparius TaxID=315576 RepID=A0A9N9WXG8_9DIPT|nr:unnamed protein product [Chironomus riparius]
MNKLVIIAFVGLCSTLLIGNGDCKELDFHFIKMVKMNESDELFKYDLKSVEKIDQTSFKVNSEIDLFVDLDAEWHFWIQIYRNEDGSENFDEKPLISIPKKEFCEFMKTTYKQYFWESLEKSSNLPPPETCPIKAGNYWIKDYIFDGGKYKSFAKGGGYRVDMFVSQDHEESHITKMGVQIFGKVEEKE